MLNLFSFYAGRCCARLHPSVHLCQDEIQALSCICFVIEDELSLQVVQLEQLNTNFIAVCDEQSLRTIDRAAILVLLHLCEESLQRVDEWLELVGAPIGHIAEGANARS